MTDNLVIARDANGRPLKRVAVSATRALIYLSHPDRLGAVNSGDTYPVGFPRQDVYMFDIKGFSELSSEYEKAGKIRVESWGKLMPCHIE